MIDRRELVAGLGAVATVGCSAAAPSPARRREVLAFYYGWYGNPAGEGAWIHWRGPGAVAAPRQSPALDTPRLGEYDSHAAPILAQHVAWAKQAGITVLISSWWGVGSFEDGSLALLLEAAHAQRLRVCVYVESQSAGAAGAMADLHYLADRYGGHPAFFRVAGRPVYFIFSGALKMLPARDWRMAALSVRAAGHPEPLLIGDASPREDDQFAAWAPFLDGIHVYVLAPYVAGMAPAAMAQWVRRTYPMWKAKIRDRIFCATIMPGFDDRLVPGRPLPRPTVGRNGGRTFETLWSATIDARPDWIAVTSFNEWHEGSEIEPSTQYGRAYLDINARYAARFLAGQRA